MKIELKHLAPYLPYGLKILREGEILELCGLSQPYKTNDNYFVTGETKRVNGTYKTVRSFMIDKKHIDVFKPILRPLSSLTKEIEHNGERFVPFVEIAKIEAPNIEGSVEKLRNITAFNRGLSFSYNQQGVIYKYEGVLVEITRFKYAIFHKKVFEGNNSWVFSYFHNYPKIIESLYKWHFDVHNLIPAGLAIDINSITAKQI